MLLTNSEQPVMIQNECLQFTKFYTRLRDCKISLYRCLSVSYTTRHHVEEDTINSTITEVRTSNLTQQSEKSNYIEYGPLATFYLKITLYSVKLFCDSE